MEGGGRTFLEKGFSRPPPNLPPPSPKTFVFIESLLLDGYIKDPHALASRATKLLEQASAWYADVKKL